MPICHCGGSGVLQGLIRRFYKAVIQRYAAPKKCLRHNIITRFCITNRHCEAGFSVGRRGTKCPSPQVGAGRYSGDNPNNPIKSKAIQKKRSRTNLWFSAMTCGWWNASKYVIAHLLRDLWIASSQAPRNDEKSLLSNPLPKIRARNEGKRKAAFTLAEVLITLGVIGIVAAMTLPTLIANYQKKVVETRLISFYSKINR